MEDTHSTLHPTLLADPRQMMRQQFDLTGLENASSSDDSIRIQGFTNQCCTPATMTGYTEIVTQ